MIDPQFLQLKKKKVNLTEAISGTLGAVGKVHVKCQVAALSSLYSSMRLTGSRIVPH